MMMGRAVEPQMQLLLSTVFINGSIGIGTGWSTYTILIILDVIKNIKLFLENKELNKLKPGIMVLLEQLQD